MKLNLAILLVLILLFKFGYSNKIKILTNNSTKISGVHFRIITYPSSLEHLSLDTIVNNSTIEFDLENTFARIELPEFSQSFPIFLNSKQNKYEITFTVSEQRKLEFKVNFKKGTIFFDEHLLLIKQFNLINDFERIFEPKYLKIFENSGPFYKIINDSFELHQFSQTLSHEEIEYLKTKKQILKLTRIPNHEKKFFLLYNDICQKLNDSKFLRETDLLYELFKFRNFIQKKDIESPLIKTPKPIFFIADEIARFQFLSKIYKTYILKELKENEDFFNINKFLSKIEYDSLFDRELLKLGFGYKLEPFIGKNIHNNEVVNIPNKAERYFVLYFYNYDCDYCKSSSEELIKQYQYFTTENISLSSFSMGTSTIKNTAFPWENDITLEKDFDYQNFKNLQINYTPAFVVLSSNFRVISKPSNLDELFFVLNKLKSQ